MNRPGTSLPLFLHRLAAVVGLGCVLVLAVLAVRPDLHELVCHHHEHDAACGHSRPDEGEAEGCVVTHFAAGEVLLSLVPALAVVFAAFLVAVLGSRCADLVVTRGLRLPPPCGPPRG